MVSTSWDLLELRCGCCGHKMILKNGEWGCFYICDQNNQDDYNKDKNKIPCYNKMNVDIYEKILDKISTMLIEDEEQGIIRNYKGYTWEYKTSHQHYKFKIKNNYTTKVVVMVTNMRKKHKSF